MTAHRPDPEDPMTDTESAADQGEGGLSEAAEAAWIAYRDDRARQVGERAYRQMRRREFVAGYEAAAAALRAERDAAVAAVERVEAAADGMAMEANERLLERGILPVGEAAGLRVAETMLRRALDGDPS